MGKADLKLKRNALYLFSIAHDEFQYGQDRRGLHASFPCKSY